MTVHVPILVDPIVSGLLEPFLNLPESVPPHWIVDCTLGGGGHTAAFLEALVSDPKLAHHKVLSIDQDAGAVERARVRFAEEIAEGRLELLHSRFGDAASAVKGRPVLGLMADLGFSSDQIEDGARGLSFQSDGPLDMRLNPDAGESCADYLARVNERDLANVIYELGEERLSRKIAASIVRARAEGKSPKTTQELVSLIIRATPSNQRHGRIHPATRTFQALRIAVNGELDELDALLDEVIPGVLPGGRVAIISFHSLEDRRVKQKFKHGKHEPADFHQITKKPIEADEAEVERNPRSRSAKLRIAERS